MYTYCKNNPIIRIDPNGKDDYVVNRNGYIYLMRKTNSAVDVLYASGINGPKATQLDPSWKSIQVSDKSVLDGFVKSQTGRTLWDRMEFSSTHSISDAANIFLFATDNTNVEWTLKGGYINDKETYILGTNNNENSVTNIYGLTNVDKAIYPDFKAIFDIHSHPNNPFASQRDMDNVKKFMDVKYGIYYKDERTFFSYTDKEKRKNSITVSSMDDLIKYIFQQFK